MATYHLTSSMADRMQLDEDVITLADDMGRGYDSDEMPSDEHILALANEQCDLALQADETDDTEEYRARFIAAFIPAFKASHTSAHVNA